MLAMECRSFKMFNSHFIKMYTLKMQKEAAMGANNVIFL